MVKHDKDPMKLYQPIVKNLRNMALRNRNFLATEKVKMPMLNADKMIDCQIGFTSLPGSPLNPKSPVRQQYYQKYIHEDDKSVR